MNETNNSAAVLPEPTGETIEARVISARSIIKTIFDEATALERQLVAACATEAALMGGTAAPPAPPLALPQLTGARLELMLVSAPGIIADMDAKKKAMASSLKAVQDRVAILRPLANTQGSGDAQTAQADDGVSVQRKTAIITRYPTGRSTMQGPNETAQADDGVSVQRKTAIITRYPTGRSCRPVKVASTAPENSLVDQWWRLKIQENAGGVPAGTAFNFFRQNKVGLQRERTLARNPDAFIPSPRKKS